MRAYIKFYLGIMSLLFFLCLTCTAIAGETGEKWKLSDIFSGQKFTVQMESHPTPSVNPKNYLYMQEIDQFRGILSASYISGKITDTLINGNTIRCNDTAVSFTSFIASQNERFFLLQGKLFPIYRHSFSAIYYLIERGKKDAVDFAPGRNISSVSFSPDSKRIAYVFERNLYVYEIVSKQTQQITTDGKENQIINGGSDWVYEEEFGLTDAYCWSADAAHFAFYRFDESAVKEFSFTSYKNQIYPGAITWKYPKAGEENSKVEIWVYDLEKKSSACAFKTGSDMEYVPHIQWAGNRNKLLIHAMNRLQNKIEFLLYDIADKSTEKVYAEFSPENYIDAPGPCIFAGNDRFYFLSEQHGWKHLYSLSLEGGKLQQLTKGNWEIDNLIGYDATSGTIYFRANKDNSLSHQLYKSDLNGKKIQKIIDLEGSQTAVFNGDFSLAMLTYSSANKPPQKVLANTQTGKKIRVISSNDSVLAQLTKLPFSPKKFIRIPGTQSDSINGWVIYPKNFNPSIKYPAIIHIYGGPGRNMVVDQWSNSEMLWHQYMSSRGYFIFSFDGHGTQMRGKKFRTSTYGQLGNLETQDMIMASRYLKSLGYIDSLRIGIQGWSFGGFLSLLSLAKGSSHFAAAASVAPVTHWKYYDNIYTERYMGLPDKNPRGYDENSPLEFASSIKGKLFLIHGTADDNVHFQNSVEMIRRMQESGIPFDLMIYPDKNHGISGGKTRLDVYSRISEWWDNVFVID
jgi:dipeptidyl-peptidase-4